VSVEVERRRRRKGVQPEKRVEEIYKQKGNVKRTVQHLLGCTSDLIGSQVNATG